MRTRTRLSLLLLVASLIVVNALIWAGTTGRIEGIVTDGETGQPVSGASVQIVGTMLGDMTDTDGKYNIKGVEPGIYTLRVTHVHYQRTEIAVVQVASDSTTEVLFSLEKGSTEHEKIVVRAECDALKSNEAQSTLTIPCLPSPNISNKKNEMSMRGYCGSTSLGFPPAHGGSSIVNGEPFDAMFFKHHGVNPFVDTEDDHLSTFAVDVDDASYVMTRSYLNRGYLPPEDAVRTEEFVNHFSYNYDAPDKHPFAVFLEGAPSRFGENCRLLKIGIKGCRIEPENRKPANLVFVIDVSGSMAREDRLSLVKKALRLLVDELRADDRVGIVVYGSRGREVLRPTSVERRHDIVAAIESLCSGGSTNAEEGLRLGYEMARKCFEKSKINRVILCSDGVANVGRTGPDEMLKQIKEYARQGITLTTVGFSMGNFNDILMEKLGDKGNGHYAYVDNLPEARRIFVDNLTGTLQVIARDVKIQVDFNPKVVRSYRLLGYENRDVADDKFRDDKEDGGEIGSGHEVTALYEIKFHKSVSTTKVGTVFIRYKDPDSGEVTETSHTITGSMFGRDFAQASPEFKLAAAAAELAEILRDSYWARESKLTDVLALVKEISLRNDSPEVIELMSLVSKADQYTQQRAEK
ncbi:MAG: von Willebrand factor type A domain-containing protein [bacterium]